MNGIPNDKALSIHITNKCNLKCPGCYTLTGKKAIKTIDYKHIEQAMGKIRPEYVIFFGGEAILEPEIIRKTMKNYPDIKYILHTNGTNLTVENKDIFNGLYKICLTLDSINYEWLSKNKNFTKEEYDSLKKTIELYSDKIIVTHNVFASHNDKSFFDEIEKFNFPIDWYIFITKARDQEFYSEFRKYFDQDFSYGPNITPKLRLLTDGTVTRDMRGVYNICSIEDYNPELEYSSLPVPDKCQECRLKYQCFAYNMFPHFVKDIIDNSDYEPHFCKFTRFYWRTNG